MILDTNAVSALLAGDKSIKQALGVAERHHLSAVVLGEYRYGLRSSRHRHALEALLDELESESLSLVVDGATARHYADIRDELKVAGRPIPENDIWIAALARQHRLPVVSRDAHFDEVSGVRRIGW
jgi:predicted nucleic acid-binding protein